MKAGSQTTDKNGGTPRDRRAGVAQMEFVILSVLIAAAVVTVVIFYGQTLRRQFSVAAHATAGKADQSAKLQRESARGAAGDIRKPGSAYGSKYSDNGAAKTVDKEDLAPAEKRTEPAPEPGGETIQAPTDFGTNLTLTQTREINEQAAAQEESGRAAGGREKPPVKRNVLLWIVLGVLGVGGLLVFLFTARLR